MKPMIVYFEVVYTAAIRMHYQIHRLILTLWQPRENLPIVAHFTRTSIRFHLHKGAIMRDRREYVEIDASLSLSQLR